MSQPKVHFDIAALCDAAHSADIGIIVSTNNPRGFKRIMYAHFAEHPASKLHIYADRSSPNRFGLLKLPKEDYA